MGPCGVGEGWEGEKGDHMVWKERRREGDAEVEIEVSN